MNPGRQNQPPASAMDGSSVRTTGPNSRVSPDKETEHLWRYFALHAQQRVSVFNFFVVFSGIIATGIGGALQPGRPTTFMVVVLGFLLALISFVFFQLDRRNSDLIKISERALRASEKVYLPDYAQIFEREASVGPNSAFAEDRIYRAQWTFGQSFRLLFLIMGTMGLVASIYSAFQLYQASTIKTDQPQKAETSSGVGMAPAVPPAVRSGSAEQPPRQIEKAPAAQPGGTGESHPNSAPATGAVPGDDKNEKPKN